MAEEVGLPYEQARVAHLTAPFEDYVKLRKKKQPLPRCKENKK